MNNQIKKCVFEMITDRGYMYNPNIDLSSDEFKIFLNNKQYLLKFILEDIKSSQIKDIINTLLDDEEQMNNIEKVFIILIKTFNYNYPRIEIMYSKHFKINITKHIMTYKHELASVDEINLLKQIMGLKNLPIIFESDPMVRWYGWKPGQICKITRPLDVYYRLIKN
jgi:DNA-directed RNA polymerase subunit H (RpoH/RPB5)